MIWLSIWLLVAFVMQGHQVVTGRGPGAIQVLATPFLAMGGILIFIGQFIERIDTQ